MLPFVQRSIGLQCHRPGLPESGQPGRTRRPGTYRLRPRSLEIPYFPFMTPANIANILRGIPWRETAESKYFPFTVIVFGLGPGHDSLGDDQDIRGVYPLEPSSQRGRDQEPDR